MDSIDVMGTLQAWAEMACEDSKDPELRVEAETVAALVADPVRLLHYLSARLELSQSPTPEVSTGYRRTYRCCAEGCDAELQTSHDLHHFGWHFDYDHKLGQREWCIAHRPTEPDTIEALQAERFELLEQLHKEQEECAMMSGDVAQLDMVRKALKKVLKDCAESEDPGAYGDFYAFVEMIENGDYWYEEYTGP